MSDRISVDEVPDGVKLIVIGAMILCSDVAKWVDDVMRSDVSDEEACKDVYRVYGAATMLNASIHKSFNWEDISRMMRDVGIVEETVSLKSEINMPDGSVVHVDPKITEMDNEMKNKDSDNKVGG